MKKFDITLKEVREIICRVEADTEEEAKTLVIEDIVDEIGNYTTSDTCSTPTVEECKEIVDEEEEDEDEVDEELDEILDGDTDDSEDEVDPLRG